MGLKRKGLTANNINKIRKSVNIIFYKNDTIENNINKNIVLNSQPVEIREIIDFLESKSKRGIAYFEND